MNVKLNRNSASLGNKWLFLSPIADHLSWILLLHSSFLQRREVLFVVFGDDDKVPFSVPPPSGKLLLSTTLSVVRRVS